MVKKTLAIFCCSYFLAACPALPQQEDAGVRRDANGDGADAGSNDAWVADVAITGDAWTPHDNWLRNSPERCGTSMLVPDPGEESHWCASRLTPPRYPFEVQRVRYIVGHGDSTGVVTCDATLSHQLQVFVVNTNTLPAEPTGVQNVTIPVGNENDFVDDKRYVEHTLDTPILLQQGEHLVMAVQFAGVHPNVMCMPSNDIDAYEGDRNYWSNAAATPFSWVQLDSFGLMGSLLMSAYGEFQ